MRKGSAAGDRYADASFASEEMSAIFWALVKTTYYFEGQFNVFEQK
jgi:hypothetical protein